MLKPMRVVQRPQRRQVRPAIATATTVPAVRVVNPEKDDPDARRAVVDFIKAMLG